MAYSEQWLGQIIDYQEFVLRLSRKHDFLFHPERPDTLRMQYNYLSSEYLGHYAQK
jgi:hypothetical protein